MKLFLSSNGLLFGLLFAAVAAVAEAEDVPWKSPGFLVDSFVELAMKNGYSTRQNPVRKWMTPVRYFTVHRVGDEDLHRELIDAHFLHLARITGLGIRPMETRDAANFLVVLTSEGALESDLPRYFGSGSARRNEMLFRNSLCMASFATERRGTIVRAVAMIPVDAARAMADLASCVVEKLTPRHGPRQRYRAATALDLQPQVQSGISFRPRSSGAEDALRPARQAGHERKGRFARTEGDCRRV